MTEIIIEEDGWVHIQHEPAREYRTESVFEEAFGDIDVDVKIEDRRKKISITPVFKVEHKPATQDHLYQILRAFFESRGINLKEDLTFDV